MTTAKVEYLGELRTEATHTQSASILITDAPIDNNGKGAAFSPTDLTATSLASCMMTIMGIKVAACQKSMVGTVATVKKVMYGEPRRIGEIHIHMQVPANDFTDKEKIALIQAAHHCPVAKSLHPDILQQIEIEFIA